MIIPQICIVAFVLSMMSLTYFEMSLPADDAHKLSPKLNPVYAPFEIFISLIVAAVSASVLIGYIVLLSPGRV